MMIKMWILLTLFVLGLDAEMIRTDKAIIDSDSGLMWQDDADNTEKILDWYNAVDYCENLKLSGYDNWYLPSMKELLTITDKSRKKPAVYPAFKHTAPGNYWSTSKHPSEEKFAYYVDFKFGYAMNHKKTMAYHVRCVRPGQSALAFEKLFQSVVERKLVKDIFETEAEFATRAEQEKPKVIRDVLEMTYGKPHLEGLNYDAENGYFVADLTFEAKKNFRQKVAITVPREQARGLYALKDELQPVAVFEFDGKSVQLSGIDLPYDGKHYMAKFTDRGIQSGGRSKVGSGVKVAQSGVETFDTAKLKSFRDLDVLLSKAKQSPQDKKKWLFVVGIEQYEFTDNIAFARRSADMFVKTAQKVLGVPKQNSYVMLNSDATQARIKTNLKKMLRRVQSGDTIYFYYNGHGVPVPSQKNKPYLLASNTEPDFVQDESFFSLQNIYSTLSDSKASKVIAVVDSCFSGVTDGKAVLKGVAATRVVAKQTTFDQQKMVVLTAGKGHQYSNAYTQKGYRLFSFYVMKNMLEGEKEVKSLYKTTKTQTYETSLREYGDLRVQEPTLQGNARLSL